MSSRRGTGAVVAVVLVASISGARAAPAQTQTPARDGAAAADLSTSVEAAARLVSPAVVQIFTTSYAPGEALVPRSADLITTQRASGSGVILDPDGYIVTNAHVVRGARRLRIEIPAPAGGKSVLATSSRTVGGQLVGIDLETDLAVIKVNERNLPTITFGDSEELRAGQLVLAFGSPLGLTNSVSLGVVSAAARQLEPDSPMIYVQTDASLNPGSSGGPLVDLRGRLVGINTLIASQAGRNEGVGFAAPSNIVRAIFEQIKATGRVRRGDIGVRAQTVTPELAAGLGLARDYGVVLADVMPDSPAAKAGLRPGDLVLTLDGKTMENGRQLQVNLYRRFVGEAVTLEILREGQTLKARIAVAERPDAFVGLLGTADPRQNVVPRLGILGVNLDATVAKVLPVVRVRSGVVVASTVPGATDSRDGGLAPGDVVYAVNRKPVASLADLRAAVDALKIGDAVVLQIERRGQLIYVTFTVE